MTPTNFRQWVGSGGISDHSPIYLELAGSTIKPRTPYKLNSSWLKDPDYLNMVTDYWNSHPLTSRRWKVVGFYNNLHHLKRLSIDWAKQKKAREDLAISELESQIANLMDEHGIGYNSIESKVHLVEMEAQRSKILLAQEETWQLRSKAIWLQAGDGNIKFFHKFANERKASDTIW